MGWHVFWYTTLKILEHCNLMSMYIYCRVPARWVLQQTNPGLRAVTRHGARDPLVRPQVDQTCKPDQAFAANDLIHVKHLTWLFSHNYLYKNLKKKRITHLIRFFTKAGWAWHVTIYSKSMIYFSECGKYKCMVHIDHKGDEDSYSQG